MLSKKPIYLDCQASTPIADSVALAMEPFRCEEFANPHSAQHLSGLVSSQAIDTARKNIAKFIGADDNEIIFTSGATEANNLALLGLRNLRDQRNRILVSAIEHKSVLAPADYLKAMGFIVEYIPVSSQGEIDLQALKKIIDDDVLIMSVMSANNETGSVQAIQKCAELAHDFGAYFHTDATQAAVHAEIDIKNWDVDLLSLSSHKMYGPKGVGALFVAREIQEKITPIIFGGDQERGLRSGTLATSLCVGFGAAAENLMQNRQSIRDQIVGLRNLFWMKLEQSVDQIHLIGQSIGDRHIGNVCVSFEGVDADDLLGILQADVAASTGSACTSGNILPSHVLIAMGLSEETIAGSVRFSFGTHLSEVDIDMAVQLIDAAVKLCRS